jgi:glyoxylase-like metal-dependent hydrolase (beta-lactamase superfamily II)
MSDESALLERFDVACVRADNPGPFTLTGTNTWVLGRDPCWIVDPGPLLEEHLRAVLEEAARRGGIGGIAVTHEHADHVEAVEALHASAPGAPLARGARDGDELGPLRAIATPGHAAGHVAWAYGRVCCTGDAVLGQGSVFVAPSPGALSSYLAALRRLRGMAFELLAPGHGPPVADPAAKLDEYVAHRLDRERRLLDALAEGRRTAEELLDAAWSDAPEHLRPAAAVTLAAHLDKLAQEGRLPDGVQRPAIDPRLSGSG